MGFLDVLSKIVNPTFGAASALGTGMAQNRAGQNEFADSRGRTLANIYGSQLGAQTGIYGSQANQQTSQYNTQQQAMLQALLGASNEGQGNAVIDLNRRKFALDAPSTRASQAVRGSLLQSAQPSTLSGGSSRLQAHTPTISGGANDPLGPGAREAGRLLEGGALAGLRSGDAFDPLPKTDFQGGVMKPPGILAAPTPIAAPKLPDYQGPGGLESLLGALGLGKGIIDDILRRRRARSGSGDPNDPDWQGPPLPPDLVEGDYTGDELTPETSGRMLPPSGWPELYYGPDGGDWSEGPPWGGAWETFTPDDEYGWG